jgi:hypothetical protein
MKMLITILSLMVFKSRTDSDREILQTLYTVLTETIHNIRSRLSGQ